MPPKNANFGSAHFGTKKDSRGGQFPRLSSIIWSRFKHNARCDHCTKQCAEQKGYHSHNSGHHVFSAAAIAASMYSFVSAPYLIVTVPCSAQMLFSPSTLRTCPGVKLYTTGVAS